MRRSNLAPERLCVAGIEFDFVPQAEVLGVLEQWRACGRRAYVCITNPHSVMLCRRDAGMRRATAGAALTLPDGVGIVVAAKLLGYGRRHRVTGPALMLELCDRGRAVGLRHYFLGGAAGIPQRLAERLSGLFPGLIVAGAYSPPFRALSDAEDQAMVEQVNAARPDIVWVGLGAPKQEKWMAEHLGRIEAAAMIGVGAAFDFHSGNVRWAPRWVRRWGIEWAYRLLCEPRRMWRRNLDSPLFLLCVLGQALRQGLAGVRPAAEPGLPLSLPLAQPQPAPRLQLHLSGHLASLPRRRAAAVEGVSADAPAEGELAPE